MGIIEATDFHPTQPWLITGNYSGNVKIYNLESGAVVRSFSLSPVSVYCVRFIARKNWYIVGSNRGWLHVFNCNTHEEVAAFKAHPMPLRCLAIHPTLSIVLSGSWDETVKAWDWDKEWYNTQTYQGKFWFQNVTFNSDDPNTFASGCNYGFVSIWSITSPIPSFTLKAHDGSVNSVDFYPGSERPHLVTASHDNVIKVWNYLSRSCVRTIPGHTTYISFAVFHPSLPIIISGDFDGTIKIWNGASYGLEHSISYKLGSARCIAHRQDTSEVAVGFDHAVATLSLAHSEPVQMAVFRDDMSGEASREQDHEDFEGRDMKEPAMCIITEPERKLELAQSPDSLTFTHDISLSPFPAPSQSQREYQHELELNLHQECINLAMELIATKPESKLISELKDDRAQDLVDFLSKIINGENTFTPRNRKHTLYVLSKLAKSAQVFPQSLELEGVQCILRDPVAAGGYGFIYKGEHEGSEICIKAVKVDSRGINKKKLRAHAGELIFWAHLSHPNVLPFLGIYPSEEKVSRVCIVSPWMNNGDLLEYLNIASRVSRKPLVRDILSGLQYLHDLDIIHADLKAKNVLISANGRAMLADFGISRLSMTHTTILTNAGTGSTNWMAPELHLEDEPISSRESDIWAFACTCYEMITGMMPFNQYRNPAMMIGAFLRGKIVPLKPTPGIGWDEDVWSVAEQCWQSDPANRPSAHELLDVIDGFKFLDDRPSDTEIQRKKNDVKVDYARIFSILDEIRQSCAV